VNNNKQWAWVSAIPITMLPPINNKTKKMNLKDGFGHIIWLSKYGRGFNVWQFNGIICMSICKSILNWVQMYGIEFTKKDSNYILPCGGAMLNGIKLLVQCWNALSNPILVVDTISNWCYVIKPKTPWIW
jgi:hypothetical protein